MGRNYKMSDRHINELKKKLKKEISENLKLYSRNNIQYSYDQLKKHFDEWKKDPCFDFDCGEADFIQEQLWSIEHLEESDRTLRGIEQTMTFFKQFLKQPTEKQK